MFIGLPKMLSRSNCILILVMSNLANCAPLKSRKRPMDESEQGFSASPRILELQLPLKITSKEDLVAWSKYVTSLVTSKINLTSIGPKDASPLGTRHDSKHLSLAANSASKLKGSIGDRQQGSNYPARRLKTPHVQRGDDKVVAYPLPVGGTRTPADPFGVSSINGPIDQHPHRFGHRYASFDSDNLVQQSRANVFGNLGTLAQQPVVTYLPQPMRTDVITTYHRKNIIGENVSSFEQLPRADFQAPSNALDPRIGGFNGELGQALPIAASNDLTGTNLSHFGEPLLAFPFQAVITITRQLPADATTSKTQTLNEYFAVRARNPPDEFPPYFEKNYTATGTTGNKISVNFNDITADQGKKKTTKKMEQVATEENEEDERDATRGNENTSEKRTKSAKRQKSRKRQSTTLVDLLRTLGILRRPPKNATEVSVATPILSILKGTNPQKIQVSFDETPPNRDRRNETVTFEAQVDDDEEEDEEEEGGSIQALIDLLPLAAPLLEDLSDPESDINISEVIQSVIPLLEDLSNPDEEGGIDFPAVLVPFIQRLSQGPNGESDSGAILGPLIQVAAPVIGPILGPLIGPLSRTVSGGGGLQGSASLIPALSAPLSEPQDPYGQSVLSRLIAGVTAGLSKEFATSDSDVQALVSQLVAGVLAGTSSGSSGHKGAYGKPYGRPYGQNDTSYSPTTYGGGADKQYYYGPTPTQQSSSIKDIINDAIKQVLGAFVKLSAMSSTSSATLSASSSNSGAGLSASSSEGSSSHESATQQPAYGVPTNPPYQRPPTYYTSTSSPYATIFARRQVKPIKRF